MGGLLLLGVTGCTTLPPGDVRPDEGAAETAPACELARPPSPPDGGIGEDGSEQRLVFALRTAFSDTRRSTDDGTVPIGYDLDGHCTLPGHVRTSCRLQDGSRTVLDGPAGRDHSLNEVILQAEAFNQDTTRALLGDSNQDAAAGLGTFVIALDDYNRQPDDRDVAVGLYMATLWPSIDERIEPQWDGNDAWRPTSPWSETRSDGSSTAGGRFAAADAYVADGVLVVHFDQLMYGTARAPLGVLMQGVVTGTLTELPDGQWAFRDGVLAGRWPADNLVGLAAIGADGECATDNFTRAVRDAVCDLRDVSATGNDDGDAPCDAFSMVIGFEAEPAKLGEPLPIMPLEFPACETLGCDGKVVSLTVPR